MGILWSSTSEDAKSRAKEEDHKRALEIARVEKEAQEQEKENEHKRVIELQKMRDEEAREIREVARVEQEEQRKIREAELQKEVMIENIKHEYLLKIHNADAGVVLVKQLTEAGKKTEEIDQILTSLSAYANQPSLPLSYMDTEEFRSRLVNYEPKRNKKMRRC